MPFFRIFVCVIIGSFCRKVIRKTFVCRKVIHFHSTGLKEHVMQCKALKRKKLVVLVTLLYISAITLSKLLDFKSILDK